MLLTKWQRIMVIPFMITTIMLGVLTRKIMYAITAMQLYRCMWNTQVWILYIDHSGRACVLDFCQWSFVTLFVLSNKNGTHFRQRIMVIPFMITTIMLGVLTRKIMYAITAMQLYRCMWNTQFWILYIDHSGRACVLDFCQWSFVTLFVLSNNNGTL
jgi:hypothetical protein